MYKGQRCLVTEASDRDDLHKFVSTKWNLPAETFYLEFYHDLFNWCMVGPTYQPVDKHYIRVVSIKGS